MLVKQALAENSTSVIWAIARRSVNRITGVFSRRCSRRATRRDAWRAAGSPRECDSQLRPCRCSNHWRKIPTTPWLRPLQERLKFQRAAKNADALMEALLHEEDPSWRWNLIDALLEVADPGDSHRPFPRWVSEVFRHSPSLEQDYVIEKLKAQRKSLEEEAKKRDKK